jgi:RNA polymerase sigma factor (sigma-70 family)
MSKTKTERGDASTIISDLSNPILWTEVQALVLPKVRRALRAKFHLPPDSHDADDAVQSGVRVLLTKNNSTDPRDHIALTLRTLEGWLVTTSWRKLNDKYGKKAYRSEIVLREEAGKMFESSELPPLEKLLADEEREMMIAARLRLADLHSTLNEEQQTILQLRLLGTSERDTANALGMTRSRVSAALKSILDKARDIWGHVE